MTTAAATATITVAEAVKFMTEESEGRFFAVDFVKRSTGEHRHMTCRIGVKKHLTGAGPAYDSKAKNLVTVFDTVKGGYRAIPVENIIRLKIDGEWKDVVHETQA